ncbi:MAG: hypothetical protein Q8L76_07805, partial [Cypionkella sp.]|nr:hypothetical protein [Cypionkella sp.]
FQVTLLGKPQQVADLIFQHIGVLVSFSHLVFCSAQRCVSTVLGHFQTPLLMHNRSAAGGLGSGRGCCRAASGRLSAMSN